MCVRRVRSVPVGGCIAPVIHFCAPPALTRHTRCDKADNRFSDSYRMPVVRFRAIQIAGDDLTCLDPRARGEGQGGRFSVVLPSPELVIASHACSGFHSANIFCKVGNSCLRLDISLLSSFTCLLKACAQRSSAREILINVPL